MKIAKPLLMVTTPIGVATGLLEAYHLTGGPVILMAAMLALVGTGFGLVVSIIRREKQEERARNGSSAAGLHERSLGRS